jgi:transposase
LPFNFTIDNLKGICSLSAGDPQASSSSYLALRGLARLANPAGVSQFLFHQHLFGCIISVIKVEWMDKMIRHQHSMQLSSYMGIYDIVVPKDNLLRSINEIVVFSFVYNELKDKYCLDNGRDAINPIRMFKYLLLKSIHNLSDEDIVERSQYDMSFKYFLDMAPEEKVIDPSSLTKFRKLRLKDVGLLDMLIGKTVEIAIEKGIIKSKSIIVDATHTKARYNQKSPREVLMDRSKVLRKAIYQIDESMKAKFPKKSTTDLLEDEISYCQKLIDIVEKEKAICEYPKVKEKLNFLKETVEDDIEHLQISEDQDAKIGHKTADSSFFGYKTHIAISEERIITAATITTGEKNDGKQLETLIEKSIQSGMNVDTVIGVPLILKKKISPMLKKMN